MADAAKRHRTPAETVQLARRHTARTALLLAILSVLTLGFAGVGLHEQMFDIDYAVRTLAMVWAPGFAVVALILGGLALLAAVLVPPRRDLITALAAVALAGLAYAAASQIKALAAANPPIHDVATDWTDPLMFGPKLMAGRGETANTVEADPRVQAQPQAPNLTGTRVAEVNARTCAAAAPIVVIEPTAAAYDRARVAMLRRGLVLVTENPVGGRVEAEATTRWLKLKSDVLVRIKPEGAGARIDIRAISREGIADLGQNCRWVGELRAAMTR